MLNLLNVQCMTLALFACEISKCIDIQQYELIVLLKNEMQTALLLGLSDCKYVFLM